MNAECCGAHIQTQTVESALRWPLLSIFFLSIITLQPLPFVITTDVISTGLFFFSFSLFLFFIQLFLSIFIFLPPEGAPDVLSPLPHHHPTTTFVLLCFSDQSLLTNTFPLLPLILSHNSLSLSSFLFLEHLLQIFFVINFFSFAYCYIMNR